MADISHDELRDHWDSWAEGFRREHERHTLVLAQSLFLHARLDDARAVLEIGAGTGAAARALHAQLPDDARLAVVDLAPKMVDIARSRLPDSVDVREANAEALPFDDGAFSSVIANMLVMLVADPDRAISEAARVLAPGGVFALSVWGRPELSAMFTLPVEAARSAGIELPQGRRSNFHLGDRAQLRQRLQSHGFGRVVSWYQALVPGFRDGASYADSMLRVPRWKRFLAGYSQDRIDALRDVLIALADERLDRGDALGLDALLAVAEKR